MVTRIILIRHCEAEGNLNGSFQGSIDCDITERGKLQLDALAVRMKDVSFELIYTSPLIRAVKTAEAVGRYGSHDIILEDDLREINAGVVEGIAYTDMQKKYPYEDECWRSHPQDFAPCGGESMRQVYDRACKVICRIVKANIGKTVCVVSHGCVIRNILCRAKGLPIEKINSVKWCDNTSLSVIEFYDNMVPLLVVENDTSHLDKNIYTSCAEMLSADLLTGK